MYIYIYIYSQYISMRWYLVVYISIRWYIVSIYLCTPTTKHIQVWTHDLMLRALCTLSVSLVQQQCVLSGRWLLIGRLTNQAFSKYYSLLMWVYDSDYDEVAQITGYEHACMMLICYARFIHTLIYLRMDPHSYFLYFSTVLRYRLFIDVFYICVLTADIYISCKDTVPHGQSCE